MTTEMRERRVYGSTHLDWLSQESVASVQRMGFEAMLADHRKCESDRYLDDDPLLALANFGRLPTQS
jgi:hypothetical protein